MKYEDKVRRVCGDSWNSKTASISDREGGIGVACVVAFLHGVNPTPDNLCRHLNISIEELYPPFSRLYHYGAFTFQNLKKDSDIVSKSTDKTADHASQLAWCHLAGIASGLTGNFPTGNEEA
jgi:hypothetical protein